MEHVYKVNKIINSIFYLGPQAPQSRCFTSFFPDHMPSQDMHQEKTIGSCYYFKQSSAGGLGRCEVQVNQLLERPRVLKNENFRSSFTPRKTKSERHIMVFVL